MENIIFNDRTNSKSYFDICFKDDGKKIKFENIFAIKDYVIIKIKNNEKLFVFKGVASNSNCFTFFKFFIFVQLTETIYFLYKIINFFVLIWIAALQQYPL